MQKYAFKLSMHMIVNKSKYVLSKCPMHFNTCNACVTTVYDNVKIASKEISRYISLLYNKERLHSYLGYLSETNLRSVTEKALKKYSNFYVSLQIKSLIDVIEVKNNLMRN